MRFWVSLLVSCLLAGSLDATNLLMPEGKTLEYSYKIVCDTQQSNDNIQTAATAWKIRVKVNTISAEKALIKFEEIQYAKVNDEVRELEAESELWNYKSGSEFERELSLPYIVEYRNGKIVSISFLNEDVQFSRDMKKGFAQSLQFQPDPSQASTVENIEQRGSGSEDFYRDTTNSQFQSQGRRSSDYFSGSRHSDERYADRRHTDERYADRRHSGEKYADRTQNDERYGHRSSASSRNLVRLIAKEGSNYYRVKEASLSGKCEVKYAINRFPDPSTGNRDVINVTKILNSRDCEDKQIFVSSSFPRHSDSDCDATTKHPVSKNAVAQMSIRAVGNTLLLERFESISIIKFSPFGEQADGFQTTCNKTIVLLDVKSLSTDRADEHRGMNKQETLVSTFTDKLEQNITKRGSEKDPILFPYHTQKRCQPQKIQSLLALVAEVMVNDGSKGKWNAALSNIANAVTSLRTCSYDNIRSLLNHYIEQSGRNNAERKIFLDCLAQSGTYPALLAWKHLAMDERSPISADRKVAFLRTYTTHVTFPREATLELIKEVIEKHIPAGHQEDLETQKVFNGLITQYGTLVAQACVRDKTYRNNAVNPEEKCRNPQEHVAFLGKHLEQVKESTTKVAIIFALGETRQRAALKYLEDYATGDNTDSYVVQAQAVLAVVKIAKIHPSATRNLLHSIYMDQSNPTEARIAAVVGCILASPYRHELEKIAMSTWQESDNTVGTFVVEYMKEISNSSNSAYIDIAPHAEHALNLINEDFDDNEPIVAVNLVDNQIEELGIDSLATLVHVADEHPLAPKMLYAGLRPEIAGANVNIFDVGMLGTGVKNMLDQLVGPVSAFENKHKSFSEVLEKVDEDNKELGYQSVANKLGLKLREEDDLEILTTMTLFGSQHFVTLLNQRCVKKLVQYYFQNPARGKWEPYEMHKIVMPVDVQVIIPSSAGIPVMYTILSPTILNLKAAVDTDYQSYFKVDAKLTAAVKLVQAAGLLMVPEHKYVGASYDTMALFKPEGTLEVKLDNNRLQVSVSANTDKFKSSKDNTLAHFRTTPYTFNYNLLSLDPLFQNAKACTFLDEPREFDHPLFSRKLRDAPMIVKVKTDTFWHNRNTISDMMERYADIASFPFAICTQSWKNRHFTVEWNGPETTKQEIKTLIDWEYEPSEAQPHKEHLFPKGEGLSGLFMMLFGWAQTPTPCDATNYDNRQRDSAYRRSADDRWNSYLNKHNERRQQLFKRGGSSEELNDDVWNRRFQQQKRFQDASYKRRSGLSNRGSDESDDESDESVEDRSPFYPHKSGYVQRRQHIRQQHRDQRQQYLSSMDVHPFNRKYESMIPSKGGYSDVYPSAGQADIRTVQIAKGEKSKLKINCKIETRGIQQNEYNLQLVLAKEVQRDKVIKTIEMISHMPTARNDYQQVCLKGILEVPFMPCYYGYSHLPIDELLNKRIEGQLKINWGSSCSSPTGTYEVLLKAKKSEQQKDYDTQPEDFDRKPWFTAQCEEDRKDGLPLSDACRDALIFYSQMNNVSILIKHHNLPPMIKNLTMAAKMAFINNYYDHLSLNVADIDNPNGEVRIDAIYHYNMPALDLMVYGPTYEAHFYKINHDDSILFPEAPNLKESLGRRIADYVTDYSTVGRAVVSGNQVNTFDNQTYSYDDWDNCPHVLLMDCTSAHLFHVLIEKSSKTDDNKKTTIYVLKNKIVIKPYEDNGEVSVNGQANDLKPYERHLVLDKEHGKVVAYVDKHEKNFYVTMPQLGVQLKINRKNIVVEVSPFWKNKVCGILGDYDGDFIYEFKGPKQCAFEDGDDMAKAYALNDGRCNKPHVPTPKLCNLETDETSSSSVSSSTYLRQTGRSGKLTTQNYGCYMEKSLMTTQRDKTCFSKRPVNECRPDCRSVGQTNERVEFTCMEHEDSKATKLRDDIKRDRPLYGLDAKQTHYTKTVSVPERCEKHSSHIVA